MYFTALATDYDGTIAQDGLVSEATILALDRLKQSGCRLVMVTGRELPDLERVFPRIDLFDRLVVENGAVLYTPATREVRALGAEPPSEFVDRLRELGITPLSVGRVIVATWGPNETAVLDAIRSLGLDLQIIFNKGAVMVLPSGINKASGLLAALDDLGLSAHNTIAVGDAENDLAFMRLAGCAVAVSNALSAVKDEADVVMARPRGEGVADLVGQLLDEGESLLDAAIAHHEILVGDDLDGHAVSLRPAAGHYLIAGQSGGGKSTLANALIERIAAADFQFCIFDPEGDYAQLGSAVVFGDPKTPVRQEAVLGALEKPTTNVVVNMLGLDVGDRAGLFARLYPAILGQVGTTGRPHWLLVDEAHHMLPKGRGANRLHIAPGVPPAVFISVHPDALSEDVLSGLGAVMGIGDTAGDVVAAVARLRGQPTPALPSRPLERGETLYWDCAGDAPSRIVKIAAAKQTQKRHTRKYAEGALGEDKSFYFRGPRGEQNLRAQNLSIFLQTADGVDEATFLHHLQAGDYSAWVRFAIKDEPLAVEIAAIEHEHAGEAATARRALREAVEARYTAPADGPG